MVRWAILGTGFISATIVNAIKASDGSEVALVAGRNMDRLTNFQKAHGISRSTTQYNDAISDPEIDVVYIGLPAHMHHEFAVKAAANGKAVLSEKSLTTDMPAAHTLINGVKKHGTFFVEGLMYLAHPLYNRVAAVLADGRLGKIRAINGFYAADIWQFVNPGDKGTLYNLGCYPTSLLHFIMQTAYGEQAFAERSSFGAGNYSDHDGQLCDAALTVRFNNGVLANLQSTDSYGKAFSFSVLGDKGVLSFKTNPWLPEIGDNILEWQPYDEDEQREEIIVHEPHDAFYHQIKMVEHCIANNLSEAPRPSPRHQDSIEIMELLTEWEAHCKNGQKQEK